jgi:ribulose-phosphate 3-epimerase
MCANYENLEQEIQALEAADIDAFHIDIMDGCFVPNFGMGLQDAELICKKATKPVDVHLMIENPANYVEKFANIGASIIYIHSESDKHPTRTIQTIIDNGAKAGIAINPGTSIEVIKPLLSLLDYVLVMTVNPGFSGQKYLSFVDEKINELLVLRNIHPDDYTYKIMIDGACSPDKIQYLNAKGVEGFILGTSALFGKAKTYEQIMPYLRAL